MGDEGTGSAEGVDRPVEKKIIIPNFIMKRVDGPVGEDHPHDDNEDFVDDTEDDDDNGDDGNGDDDDDYDDNDDDDDDYDDNDDDDDDYDDDDYDDNDDDDNDDYGDCKF